MLVPQVAALREARKIEDRPPIFEKQAGARAADDGRSIPIRLGAPAVQHDLPFGEHCGSLALSRPCFQFSLGLLFMKSQLRPLCELTHASSLLNEATRRTHVRLSSCRSPTLETHRGDPGRSDRASER